MKKSLLSMSEPNTIVKGSGLRPEDRMIPLSPAIQIPPRGFDVVEFAKYPPRDFLSALMARIKSVPGITNVRECPLHKRGEGSSIVKIIADASPPDQVFASIVANAMCDGFETSLPRCKPYILHYSGYVYHCGDVMRKNHLNGMTYHPDELADLSIPQLTIKERFATYEDACKVIHEIMFTPRVTMERIKNVYGSLYWVEYDARAGHPNPCKIEFDEHSSYHFRFPKQLTK